MASKIKLNVRDIPTVQQLIKDPSSFETSRIGRTHGSYQKQKTPNLSQVALGVTSKALANLDPTSSWMAVLEAFMNNPSVEPTEAKVKYYHDKYKTDPRKWIGKDHKLNAMGIVEMKKWIKKVIPTPNLFDSEEISDHLCEQILLKSVEKLDTDSFYSTDKTNYFKDFFQSDSANRKEVSSGNLAQAQSPTDVYQESTILDWIVLDFPDDDKEDFAVYHFKLGAWMRTPIKRMFELSKDPEVGTICEYAFQRFRPRADFINNLTEATKEKAFKEAQEVLGVFKK